MSPAPSTLADALVYLRELSSEQINARLDELEAERDQLRVLLRAALVRERREAKEAALRQGVPA